MDIMHLTPGSVPLGAWRRVMLEGGPVGLDPAAQAEVERGASAVARAVAGGRSAYGVNTGFGKLASVRIAEGDLAQLQRNLILSHCAGYGPDLPDPVVRLVLAMKAASLARGASGVRWSLIEAMLALLGVDALPVIPAQGSVGASGDLAPLAHLTAALMGEGSIRIKGEAMPAAAALERIGVDPVVLMPKEGLALINGTQVSAALALAGLFAGARAFDAALVAGALSVDALRGSDTPFDARIQALRGQPGQIAVAGQLRGLLRGSAIRESHREGDERVQDPYSLRCQPQVVGACRDLLLQVAGTLALEANGVTDNPLVMGDGAILSGGNFHAEPVALAADTMALALTGIGNISERRTALLMDPVMSGLPAFLSRDPGLGSGLMIAQVTAAALASENKQRAAPASIDTIPTSAGQEDHVSMAAHAAMRLLGMADNLTGIVAIELYAAAEAVEHHRPLRSSPALEAVHALIRTRVPPLLADRAPSPDIGAIAGLIRSGEIAAAAGLDLLNELDPS